MAIQNFFVRALESLNFKKKEEEDKKKIVESLRTTPAYNAREFDSNDNSEEGLFLRALRSVGDVAKNVAESGGPTQAALRTGVNAIGSFRTSPDRPSVKEAVLQQDPMELAKGFQSKLMAEEIPVANSFLKKVPGYEQTTQYVQNRIAAPAAAIPQNVQTIKDPNAGLLEKSLAGVGVVGGAIPGVDDIPFAAIDALKASAAGKDATKGFTGEEYTGLGDVVAPNTQTGSALNLAEIPLMLVGGTLAAKSAIRGSVENLDDIPVMQAQKAADEFSYKPAQNLNESARTIETNFGGWLRKNLTKAEEDYSARFGNVLNTDNARELSPDYAADRSQSAAVHEPASQFIKQLYEKKLKEPVPEGKDNFVLFTAGGTGAGKTTAIETKPEFANTKDRAHIVYDTNMNTYDSSKKKVEQALEAGKDVNIVYVLRDPMDALANGAVPRAERMGRTVPIDAHVETHTGALETIKKLSEEYKDDPRVDIRVIDNSFGKGNAQEIPLAKLNDVTYNASEIRENAKQQLQQLYSEGKVSDKNYEGFTGEKPPTKNVGQTAGSTTSEGINGQPQLEDKERKFITSLKEGDFATPEVKAQIEGTYTPITNKETLLEAQNIIDTQGVDAAVSYVRSDNAPSALKTAVGEDLIRRFQNEGRTDAAVDIAETMAERLTAAGQEVQAAAMISRLSPEGALVYAQRQVKKINEAISPKKAQAATDVSRKIDTEMRKASSPDEVGKVADQITNELTGSSKKITKSKLAAGSLSSAETPAERLAKRVGNTLAIAKRKDDPVSDMVNTLYQVAKNNLPDNPTQPRDPLDLIRLALKNKEEYTNVWEEAQAIVLSKYKDDPEAMTKLQVYLDEVLNKPFSDEQVNKVIQNQIKSNSFDLNKIVREHYSRVNATGAELKKQLMERLGLPSNEAADLAEAVDLRYKELVTQKKQSILKQIFAEKKVALPKSIEDRIIELSNLGGFQNQYFDAIAQKFGLVSLNEQTAQKITEYANTIQQLPDGREKQVQTALMLKEIAQLEPVSTGRKVSTLQTMSHLLNPKTAVRNVLGNSLFAVAENVSDIVATPLDLAVSVVTGQRSKTLPDFTAQARGLIKGWKEGVEDAKLGIDTAGMGKQFNLPQVKTFQKGILSKLETVMNIELKAPDRAMYTAAFENSLSSQMRTAKVTVPTEEMLAIAHQDGLYRTFQDSSKISEMLSSVKKTFNKIGISDGAFGLGDLIIKYPKTPGNLLSRGLDYSPAGYVKAVLELSKSMDAGFDQKRFVEALSRATVGTGIIALGAKLASDGVITGKPAEDADTRGIQQSQGMRGFQINMSALGRYILSGFEKQKTLDGDQMKTYDWAQPLAIQLSMGADIATGAKQRDVINNMLESFATGEATLTQQGVVRNLLGFAQDVNNQGFVRATANSLLDSSTSLVPTAVNQLAQVTDKSNTVRDTYDQNPLVEAKNKAQSRIPIARSMLPARVDQYGGEMKYSSENNISNVFLNPAFEAQIKKDPVGDEVLRLFEETGETKQSPKIVEKKVNVNGEDIQLTAQQRRDMQRYVGEVTIKMFEKAVNDPQFQALKDDEKVNAMSNMISDAYTAGKIQLLGHRPEKVSGKIKNIVIEKAKEDQLPRIFR